MIEQRTPYGMGVVVAGDYAEVVGRVKEELARQGFGILSEIDVAATMYKKLGKEFKPYVILGACNPPLAFQALTAERDIGLLLPCNVVVYAADAPEKVIVAALDPTAALSLTRNDAITPVARDVDGRLRRALEAVEARRPVEAERAVVQR